MNSNKEIIVQELLERVNASPFVIVFDYKGMTVPEFSVLRDKLREVGGECHVAKNTYMRSALKQAGMPDMSENLVGQTAFVTGENDVCASAKAVKEFSETSKKGEIKCGVLDGELLDAAQVTALADLPSREVLLAQLLGVINEPATKLLRTVKEPGAALARVINAKAEKG